MLDPRIALVLIDCDRNSVAGQVLAETHETWKCLGFGREFEVSKNDPGYRVEKLS